MINITEKIVNIIPKGEFNDGKRAKRIVEFFDNYVSAPENRLILGVTALASQPFFDLYNKDVDEKTRKISCARTIAKIVSGTLTGVLIRAGFISLTKNYSIVGEIGAKKIVKVIENGKEAIKKAIPITKWKKFFTPSEAKSDEIHAYKQYQNAMGTLLAIVTMIFTNFIIDAPLTRFLTNQLTKNIDKPDLTPTNKPSGGAK